MRPIVLALLTLLPLAACGSLPATRDTPYLPPGVFGVYEDNDVGAINFAAWAFASPANTANRPFEAMKAVIALEYLAGELRDNPRWVAIDGNLKLRVVQARDDVRQALGIRPDAPPQLVVNALLSASSALAFGDQAAALQPLSSAVFTQPPAQTLALFARLPYVQSANLASSRVSDEALRSNAAVF
jgi:hypothetical protein